VILTPRSTDGDRAAVATEYDAACYVVTQVAAAAGRDGMTAALTALLDGRNPYASDPAAKRATTVATWKDWLDAVDELALMPAGASPTLASDLLVEYGVTDNRTLLAQRAEARSAYHELAAEVGDWDVPAAVRSPLAAWDFTATETAIRVAATTWTLTGQSDSILPGIDARDGPAAKAWEAARTTADLQAAAGLAQAQLGAASDVADVITLVDTPLDLVQQVGLIGTGIPDPGPAVAAVRTGDTEHASRITASIRSTITGLRDAGQLRIEVTAAILGSLLLLLLAAVALRTRAGRRRTALAAATVSAPDGALAGPSPDGPGPSELDLGDAAPAVAAPGTVDVVDDPAPTEVVPPMPPPVDG
jgi:hypothetical protein